jgi:integrase
MATTNAEATVGGFLQSVFSADIRFRLSGIMRGAAANNMLLKDPKGRGGTSRDHLVPWTKMALDVLEPLRVQNGRAAGPFVTRGEQSLHASTVSKVVTEVWKRLAAEDAHSGIENPISRFVFRDLRRTCETQLASLGVNLETRAQLLSHGRSGVQAKHYGRHTYIAEKRRALNKWAQHLMRVIDGNPAQSGCSADVSHGEALPATERA